MKSYIDAGEVGDLTVYRCRLCHQQWDSTLEGFGEPDALVGDGEGEIVLAGVSRYLAGDPRRGVDECPFCGGSTPEGDREESE